MKHPNESSSKMQVVRPGIAVGLAMLFLITFFVGQQRRRAYLNLDL